MDSPVHLSEHVSIQPGAGEIINLREPWLHMNDSLCCIKTEMFHMFDDSDGSTIL